MKQKAFVDFDKDGTTGGAVDVAVMKTRGIGGGNKRHPISVDHPFLYVIHDNKRPLMVGTVNNF
jgi:serine protease inhibitor